MSHFRARSITAALLFALPALGAPAVATGPALHAPAGATGPALHAPAGGRGGAGESQRLVVLHTNDVHGQVLPSTARIRWPKDATVPAPEQPPEGLGGLPRIGARVAELRRELEAAGAVVLVLDGGDWFQGTPEGAEDGGLGMVAGLALAGYDAMCVGNHEFDLGLGNLRRILDAAKPPAVLANAYVPAAVAPGASAPSANGAQAPAAARADFAPPWRIVERAGLRIALVGLVTASAGQLSHPEARALEFRQPVAALGQVLGELVGRADLVIPLTHVGVDEDERLARAYPSLPLIVGGHSHTLLPEGRRVGETLIVQTGSSGAFLGRVELAYDRDERRARAISAALEPLATAPAPPAGQAGKSGNAGDGHGDSALARHCAELLARTSERMAEVIGALEEPLVRAPALATASAGNFLTDVLRAAAPADVALYNRGGIRRDLEAGPVTRRVVFEMLPFADRMAVAEVTGAELRHCLESVLAPKYPGGLEISGARLRVRRDEQGAVRIESIEVGGEPLAAERVYRVATSTFLSGGGDRYRWGDTVRWQDSGRLVRELVEAAFAGGKTLRGDPASRFERIDEGKARAGTK